MKRSLTSTWLLALLVACTRTHHAREEKFMSVVASPDDVLLARAAVIVLTASTGKAGDNHSHQCSWLGPERLSFEQAARQLATLPKPRRCSAQLANDVVRVDCEQLGPDDEVLYRKHLEDIQNQTGFAGSLIRDYLGGDEAKVIISDGVKRVILTVPQFRRWNLEYLFGGNVSLSAFHASPSEQEKGIRVEVRAGRSDEYRGSLPPP